jgi:hypothetical protein
MDLGLFIFDRDVLHGVALFERRKRNVLGVVVIVACSFLGGGSSDS